LPLGYHKDGDRFNIGLVRSDFRKEVEDLEMIINKQSADLPRPTETSADSGLPDKVVRLFDNWEAKDRGKLVRECAIALQFAAVDKLIRKYRATVRTRVGLKLRFQHANEVTRDGNLRAAIEDRRLIEYPLLRVELFQQEGPSDPAASNLLDLGVFELSCRLHDICENSLTAPHYLALMYYKSPHEKRPLFDMEFLADYDTGDFHHNANHELLKSRHKDKNYNAAGEPVYAIKNQVTEDFAFICKEANKALLKFARTTNVAKAAKVVQAAKGADLAFGYAPKLGKLLG
jgi:hypothetical protein